MTSPMSSNGKFDLMAVAEGADTRSSGGPAPGIESKKQLDASLLSRFSSSGSSIGEGEKVPSPARVTSRTFSSGSMGAKSAAPPTRIQKPQPTSPMTESSPPLASNPFMRQDTLERQGPAKEPSPSRDALKHNPFIKQDSLSKKSPKRNFKTGQKASGRGGVGASWAVLLAVLALTAALLAQAGALAITMPTDKSAGSVAFNVSKLAEIPTKLSQLVTSPPPEPKKGKRRGGR